MLRKRLEKMAKEKSGSEKMLRMAALTAQLDEAAKAYYSDDREIMTNLEYDKFYDELVALEAETGVALAGSPTMRVGYSISSELVKEAHPSPMLSLDKTKDPEALSAWLGDKKGLLSWKLDGLTVALTYSDGALEKAVTRGDGTTGEVVTHTAKTFKNLPLKIPFKGTLLLRGEAVIRYSDFERINAEIDEPESKYKNPRNLASGSVRQLNSEVTAGRYVRFYAFNLVSISTGEGGLDGSFSGLQADTSNASGSEGSNEGLIRASRDAQMQFLKSQGFEIVDYFVATASDVISIIHQFAERAETSDLPSDGLVLTYDDVAYGERLGQTSKFPRDAIAFKWADELKETKLQAIEWSASRTGLINPVAIFEPVEIEGTTVSRASVHNISIMEELALGYGDQIRVYKANMIIPQIAENLTRSGGMPIPQACPVCEHPTEIRDSGEVRSLFCTNENCLARQIKSFTHFVSRNAINIEGLSEKALEKFIAAGFIKEFADLFRLSRHRDAIISMEGFGVRSYERLMEAVDVARAVTRVRLLYGLGIPTIGLANAKLICRAYSYDWDRIAAADAEGLTAIDGIGEVMAERYVEWFADAVNQGKVMRLLAEIRLDDVEGTAMGSGFEGLVFVITGSLETYPNRDALKDLIESKGGKVTGSVSEKTRYLINNDPTSASSKNKKAQSLGIPIITEEAFNAML
jgi:DNA ligase (NAD+)